MSQIMDFLVQTSCVSSDLLKEIMRDYLSGKKQKSGLKSFNKLAKTGVLESIEITDNNIKDFYRLRKSTILTLHLNGTSQHHRLHITYFSVW